MRTPPPIPAPSLALAAIPAFVLALALALLAPGCGNPGPANPQAAPATIAPPDALKAVLAAAQQAMTENAPQRAEAVLREAVRTYPQDQALRLALADVLAAMGRPDEANLQYDEALAVGPRTPHVLFHAGITATLSGDHEGGLALLLEAQAADPSNPDAAMQAGLALLNAGRLDEANAALLRATVLDDGRAAVWGALAEIALRQNQPALALQHAEKAAAIEPGRLAWTVLRARATKRAGDVAAALALLDALPAPDRFSEGVLATAGECLGLLGRAGDAAAWHIQASEAFPGDAALAYQTALWCERAGDADAAAQHAQRAVSLGFAEAQALVDRLNARP